MKIAIVRECIAALFRSFTDKARERAADDPNRASLRGARRRVA